MMAGMAGALRWFHIAIVGAVVVTLGHLWYRYSSATSSSPARMVVHQVGDQLPSVRLQALTSGGRQLALESVFRRNSCQIVYFFDPLCPACAAGAPDWSGVTDLNDGNRRAAVSWVATSDDSTGIQQFVDLFGITATTYRLADAADFLELGIAAVPSVWGVLGDTLRYTARGQYSTSPDSLRARLAWCE